MIAEHDPWRLIRESVNAGDYLWTPGRGIPPAGAARFRVAAVHPDRLVIEVGKLGAPVSLPAGSFRETMHCLMAPAATLRVAAMHSNDPLPGSVDEVVRRATGTRPACGTYVAAILEHASLVEYVMEGRQKHIRQPR